MYEQKPHMLYLKVEDRIRLKAKSKPCAFRLRSVFAEINFFSNPSFRYHRLLRGEKTKQQIKDFEALQKTDPEAALKQLEMLEKSRAEERATLRHRNTGKWARNQVIKAKYNKEVSIWLNCRNFKLSSGKILNL